MATTVREDTGIPVVRPNGRKRELIAFGRRSGYPLRYVCAGCLWAQPENCEGERTIVWSHDGATSANLRAQLGALTCSRCGGPA